MPLLPAMFDKCTRIANVYFISVQNALMENLKTTLLVSHVLFTVRMFVTKPLVIVGAK